MGTSYRTAWLIQHWLMAAMAQRETEQPLDGHVQHDDAYLGGERSGSTGRGSENKVPFVAAVACNQAGHPLRIKVSPVRAFTREAIAAWAKFNLLPTCAVLSNGLGCFAGVIDADCAHTYMVVGQRKPRKPRELPQFKWVNTILGNLKTMIYGAHKAFNFGKYAGHYLGAFAYRFNRRFQLPALLHALLGHAATAAPTPERQIRGEAEVHA